MSLNSRIWSSAAVIALTCAASAAAYYYKSRNKELNEVMVFCKLQYNAYNCFDKLMSHIEAAKKSINVCMPGIHNPAIQARLVKLLKEKNVKVRIIVDRNRFNTSTDFFVKELINAGAEIKCRVNEPFNLHHKFCLVDDKVLMTGTLNWGDDRSSDHWNYVYITTKPQLVEPVKKEFYQMWSTDMDIQQLIPQVSPDLCNSDQETAPNQPDVIVDFNDYSDISILRESQVTPELCIL